MILLYLVVWAASPLAAQPPGLRLADAAGRPFSLAARRANATVLVLLNAECPVSRRYMPLLGSLHGHYAAKGVEFYGIFLPAGHTPPVLRQFAADHAVPFRLLLDKRGKCVRWLAGRVTPEVFVLDAFGGVCYRGAIDNHYYALGKRRGIVTETYLADALEAVLNRSEIKIKRTDAIGCLIEQY